MAAGASRLARLLPGAAVLRSYDRAWLHGDVVGGITVAAYAVPQVMAYAAVAGLPAVAGLWAILPALLIYALVGSSRQLSVGPESTTSLMTAAGVGALVAVAGADRYAEVAALMALAVAVLCLAGYLLRLGFVAGMLSRPVLVGYMAGIAGLMIVSQLGTISGLDIGGGSIITQVATFVGRLGGVHVPSLALALVVLAALLALARWAPRWPGPLLAVLASAAAVAWFGLDRLGVDTVGTVPQGLPRLALPGLTDVDLLALAPATVGVAVVAYTDNVLTARAFSHARGEPVDANQEFLALSAANVGAGLFSGFPVSSSGSRTALGDALGTRTQLHSVVAAGVVLATLLWLAPVLASFPDAALGAIVIYAALRLIDGAQFRRIRRFRLSELVISLATTAAVLLLGVLPGIGVAVALSVLDLLRRIVHPHDGILGYVPDLAGMHDVDDYADARQVTGLVVYRYDSPLFFANAEDFLTRATAAVSDARSRGPVEWFLLNAEANTEVDLTAIDALEDLRRSLADEGIVFAMARVKADLRADLARAGFDDRVGDDRIFPTLPTAVRAYALDYESRHGRRPDGVPPSVL